jgi:hypothetical protein
MRKPTQFIIAALVTTALLASPAASAQDTLTTDEFTLLRVCEGVVQLFAREAGAIWSGYSLAEQPFLVYVPDRWVLLFNPTGPVDGFGAPPDEWPTLSAEYVYHEGRFEDLVGQLAFDIALGDMLVCAVGFPAEFPDKIATPDVEAFSFIAHENFHQYQRASFGEIPWAREEKYPITDLENAALAWLEMRVLEDALEAVVADNSERCLRSAQEFVAVRLHRWERGAAFIREYEQGQELLEGTAKYVELKAVEQMSGLDYVSSLDGARSPLDGSFANLPMSELLLRELRERRGEDCLQPADIPRNRIYAVGGAGGYLLDHFEVEWTGLAEEAGPGFTYASLLETRLEVDERTLGELVERAKNKYDYDAVLAATTQAAKEYELGFARELAAFESQGGVRLELVMPSSNLSRSRMSRAKKWLVDGGRSDLRSNFDVYTLRGKGWSFELHDAALLELNDWSERRKEVIIYDPAIDSAVIDGEPVSPLIPGATEFQSLELAGERFVLEAAEPGRLVITEGIVRVFLDRELAGRGINLE